MFQQVFETLKPLCCLGAICDAMICGDGRLQPHTSFNLTVSDYGSFLDTPNRQDGSFGRVNNCDEMVDIEHAQIRNCKRGSLDVLLMDFAFERVQPWTSLQRRSKEAA